MYAWFRKNLDRKERGFTLIELVVVLAIIAILIAAAVPLYLGARKKAYKAEADNALQELKTMLWAYYQQNASFPATGSWSGTPSADSNTGFQAPQSSFWSYSYTGTGSTVTMVATGTNPPVSGNHVSVILNSDGSSSSTADF
jgi:prepilin-type N-terminal cleavage/methylation domain-containing protein